jgi:hypothetical protein
MRRSTIIYLLLFLGIAGAYYYLNNREEPAADIAVTLEPESEVSYLFSFEDGAPTSIRIESKAGETVEVARDAENAWALILPTEAAADQGSAEAAASQVTVIQILDRLPDLVPQDVGLDDPEYKMNLRFTSGVERNVEVGVVTPTESGYYIRVDGGEIMIVSKYTLDSLLGLLSNPPYMPTEAPPPPTPEAVSP